MRVANKNKIVVRNSTGGGGGGVAGVTSFNSRTGVVVSASGDYVVEVSLAQAQDLDNGNNANGTNAGLATLKDGFLYRITSGLNAPIEAFAAVAVYNNNDSRPRLSRRGVGEITGITNRSVIVEYDIINNWTLSVYDSESDNYIENGPSSIGLDSVAEFPWGSATALQNRVYSTGTLVGAASFTGTLQKNIIEDGELTLTGVDNAATIQGNVISANGGAVNLTNAGSSTNFSFNTCKAPVTGTSFNGSYQFNTNERPVVITSSSGTFVGNEFTPSVATAGFLSFTGTCSYNVIGGGTFTANFAGCDILYNHISGQSIVTLTSVSSCTIEANLISDESELAATGTSSNSFSFNVLQGACYVDITNCASAIDRNTFGNAINVTFGAFGYATSSILAASLTVTVDSTAIEYRTLVPGFSNISQSLDISDVAIYDGGTDTLTIPTALQFAGIFIIANNSGDNITHIDSNSLPHPFTLTTESSTFTITPTAVASATTNDIVSDATGVVTLTGRSGSGKANDTITFQGDANGINVKTTSAILA